MHPGAGWKRRLYGPHTSLYSIDGSAASKPGPGAAVAAAHMGCTSAMSRLSSGASHIIHAMSWAPTAYMPCERLCSCLSAQLPACPPGVHDLTNDDVCKGEKWNEIPTHCQTCVPISSEEPTLICQYQPQH